MYKYKGVNITKQETAKIEREIVSTFENFEYDAVENIKDIDYFIENISFIQQGKKYFLELLTYTKYRLKEYLLSFQYGVESFSFNNNSVGVIYAVLSLLNLKLYEQAEFMFTKNEEKIIEIINSNKSNIDDFIDILIYFKVPITYIDDISEKLESLKEQRKKYIYILINLINDRKNNIIKNIRLKSNNLSEDDIENYKKYMSDIINILRELNLHQLEELYRLKLDNFEKDIDIMGMLPCDNLKEYICKALLESIDINLEERNYIPNNISSYDFEDEFVKIVSYKSKSLVSMHFIKIKDSYIIIDCGASMVNQEVKKIDIDKFLKENNIDVKKIKAIILSHAHLDHYGSLDLIQQYVDEIYMTKDTYHILDIVAKDIKLDLSKIKIKKDSEEFMIEDFKVRFFPSNHIKGSIGVHIEHDNKSIVYTGDFSFNNQVTTQYIDEKTFLKFKNADYLIIESTYGNKDIDLPYIYKKKLVNYFINLSLNNNIKVIIPSFAIGVAQECYDLINNSTTKANILLDGLAIKVSEYYNKVEKRFNLNDQLNYNICKDIQDRYYESDVIIVTGGIINEGSIAKKYYKMALEDKNMVTVLKCGYIDKDTIDKGLKPYDTIDVNLIDISLVSHAQYNDLIKTVNTIMPKNLIMVHGNGIKLYENKN